MSTFVYLVGTRAGEPVKLGFSAKPKQRLQSLQTGQSHHLHIMSTIEATQALEGYLHGELADLRMEGEWFRWDKRIEDALILMDYAAKVAPWRLAYTTRGRSNRRGANEGSIFQRKDGRWCAVLHVGYSGGRRQRKAYYGHTREEVVPFLATGITKKRGRPRKWASGADRQRAYRERHEETSAG